MTPPAIEVEDLVKTYRRRGAAPVRAVDGLSFSVATGTIFGLLGPNGAGKTTTLRVLTTRAQPTAGRARVAGFDVTAEPLEVRRRIAVVIQESAAELFLSVRDNLLTFARFHGLAGPAVRRRADTVLAQFDLAADASRKVMDLSGASGAASKWRRCSWSRRRGRQVARGDLHTLKLLSEGVYEVTITFDALPPGIEAELAARRPLRLHVGGNTVEIALKEPEERVVPQFDSSAPRNSPSTAIPTRPMSRRATSSAAT